ncbi:MAG: competence protein ComEC [Frankiales bacterium]|jgi:endonuclease YncB( thermonuclease family)|nr:competence protein ComEC [Frankiales bacterium]
MRRILTAAAVLAGIVLVAVGTPAKAYNPTTGSWTGSCNGTGSPNCYWWEGHVTNVSDGDTFDIDVANDGTTTPLRVRIVGINAMELHTYSATPSKRVGDCLAVSATNNLENWIKAAGWQVRIAAQDPNDMSGSRYHRAVYANLNGTWTNLALLEVQSGLALWMSSREQYAWNATYALATQQAAATGRGLFSKQYCGVGPTQSANLKLNVQWDADGADGASGPAGVNGEWVRIHNRGTSAVPIGGWWLRDSMLRTITTSNGVQIPGFQFPSYASVPAGGAIALFVGPGTNSASTPTRFYWNQTASVFEQNSKTDTVDYNLGDGAYLFDPQGDLRTWMIYPCLLNCVDPLAGKVRVTADYGTPAALYQEFIDITNTSNSQIDLTDFLIKTPPYSYTGFNGTKLNPGQNLRIYTGKIPVGTQLLNTRAWGMSGPILNNDGDEVSLRTYDEVPVPTTMCYRWGSYTKCIDPATS